MIVALYKLFDCIRHKNNKTSATREGVLNVTQFHKGISLLGHEDTLASTRYLIQLPKVDLQGGPTAFKLWKTINW